ncbi:MFS transporter [Kitasatospora sp. MY 5-36]|uniref:MFS transporter n=1 Tax=Kitasatospora sp. MY 5-36 TaxID=1678027 RepID=UPI000670AEC3|nr:MFS transporter [Kitasatospora sp. MY 5-36]
MTLSLTESRRRRLTLFAMCMATFMTSLDLTIVNVALPSMQSELHMGAAELEWVISAYSLSLAAVIPASGALGDRYGRKRIFLTGMVVFSIGVVACAVAWNALSLIAFRAVQGLGGAAMLALGLSIITETYPKEQRASAIGAWAAIGGTGFGAGPVGGGILLTFFGWQSVFWINLPFAALGIACTFLAVRESRNPQARRLDVPGIVLSALGLVCLTLGFVESADHPWGSAVVAFPLVAGVVLLLAFLGWERRAPHPMMPPALLRARSFASASGIYLLCYGGMSGALFWVTLYFQDVAGWSVLRTGLSWLFMNIPFLTMAQFGGRLDSRFRSVTVAVSGILLAAVGVFLLSRAGTTPFAVSALGYVLYGGGFGTFVPAVTHVAMRDVPPGASGAASGVLNASRQIGSSVCLAVLGAVGVNSAVSAWQEKTAGLDGAQRAQVLERSREVGGGRLHTVVEALGEPFRQPAVDSFLHGYQLSIGIAAAATAVAAVLAWAGFRQRAGQLPTAPEPAPEPTTPESSTPEPAGPRPAGGSSADEVTVAGKGLRPRP